MRALSKCARETCCGCRKVRTGSEISPKARPVPDGPADARSGIALAAWEGGCEPVQMRNPFTRDLVLLHAPALYDFRTRRTFLGPLADAVPSTPIFEMYPVGLTSIAAFLERNHYNVEIVNLAYRMLREPTL